MYMLVVGCGVILVVISAQMEMSTRSLWWPWRGRVWRWRLTDLSVVVAWAGIALICGSWAVWLVRTVWRWLT